MSLFDSALRAQIGKCRREASSENIRAQCGHCLRSSICCWDEVADSVSCDEELFLARPRALRICSLSCFHLGTLCWQIGRSSSVFAAYDLAYLGGLAEATLGFLFGLELFCVRSPVT